MAGATEPTAEEADDLERWAVAAALEACGYLTKQQVRRAPRPRESLERGLGQFRQQAGEAIDDAQQAGAPIDDAPIDDAMIDHATVKEAAIDDATIDKPALHNAKADDAQVANAALDGAMVDPPSASAVKPRVVAESGTQPKAAEPSCRGFISWRLEPQPSAPLLDYSARVDTMQTAPAPSAPSLDTGPPDATAHRERSNLTWWRRPITLLLTLAKAAKISH